MLFNEFIEPAPAMLEQDGREPAFLLRPYKHCGHVDVPALISYPGFFDIEIGGYFDFAFVPPGIIPPPGVVHFVIMSPDN